MTSTLLALIAAIQVASGQAAAGSNIVWTTPVDPSDTKDAAVVPVVASPSLPVWAVEDPYAWERSQCHPALRGNEPLDRCQVRVRTQLKLVLGDRLPAGLQPEGISNCRQVSNGAGGYDLTCGAEERSVATQGGPPPPEVCEQRPRALPGGGVTFERTCQAAGAASNGGLTLRLSRDD